ncbi:hypothetical protein AB832_07800 [Flavobacteriaceae bacterium (ex Bugula neritina AB1)]|nr:hypothetical protein AB832_07800 [Flavobacteriaceae bacterium (ex Bugula neritina AB1)]
MKFLRKIEANPHTKILAWWFALSKEEFNSIKFKQKSNFIPSEKSTVITYTYGRWDLVHSEKYQLVKDNVHNTYSICYISYENPIKLINKLALP